MKRKKVLGFIMTLLFAAFIFSPLQFGLHSNEIVAKAACELSAEQIVNYFNSRVGESYTSNACLAFIADGFQALGAERSSACCAYNYGLQYLSSTSRDIPIGADVFFTSDGCKYDYIDGNGHHSGHIGVYVGDGYIVHSYSSRIQKMLISTVESHGYTYWGWGYHGNIHIGPVESNITISNESAPTGNRPVGLNFWVKGLISSNYPLSRVWGGVYNADGTPTPQYCDNQTNLQSYDLDTYFDDYIIFDDLPEGYYIYRIEATDNQGYSKVLVESEFSVGDPKPANIEVSEVTYPSKEHPLGRQFNVQGMVTSDKPLYALKGGIYHSDDTTTSQYSAISVSSPQLNFDIAEYFDDVIHLDKLPEGDYIYKIEVQDGKAWYEVINYEFSVVKAQIFGDEGLTITVNPVEISIDDLKSNDYTVPISVNAVLSPNFITNADVWENELKSCLEFNTVEFGLSFDPRLNVSTNNFIWYVYTPWRFYQPDLKRRADVVSIRLPKDVKPGDVFQIKYADKGRSGCPHIYNCTIGSEKINLAEHGLVTWNDGYIKIKDELWLDETKVTLNFGEKYSIKANQSNLTYKTGNPDVAIVSKDGVVTAVGTGNATILVYNSESEVKQFEVSVTAKKVDGDINNDGTLSVTDVIALQKWILHTKNAKLTNAEAADLNSDGVVDVFDLAILKHKLIVSK